MIPIWLSVVSWGSMTLVVSWGSGNQRRWYPQQQGGLHYKVDTNYHLFFAPAVLIFNATWSKYCGKVQNYTSKVRKYTFNRILDDFSVYLEAGEFNPRRLLCPAQTTTVPGVVTWRPGRLSSRSSKSKNAEPPSKPPTKLAGQGMEPLEFMGLSWKSSDECSFCYEWFATRIFVTPWREK